MQAPAAAFDGILVIDKPVGPTSHDVVALVRRLSGARRVGHGGTLDPFARGVLPVFVGRATRLVEYHASDRKGYRATICLGASSATDDLQGELKPGEAPPPDRAAFEAVLALFRGEVRQRPPAYSAVKVAGRRAYRAAREGTPLELPERTVTIERLELVEWDAGDPARPTASVEIACSAGTYVRSLARDIGERLGCGAYLGALTRTASGPFAIDAAADLETVRRRFAAGETAGLLLPIDAGLERFPPLPLAPGEVGAVARGQVIRAAALLPRGPVERLRLMDGDRLVAIARVEGGRVHPEKVLVEAL